MIPMQATIDIRDRFEGIEREREMTLDINSHHYIVLSYLYPWMREQALSQAKGVMLDYGCGGKPYKALFETAVTRYIGADVAAAKGVQLDLVLFPDEPVPLPDESIDTVLANQTLEHVPDVHFYLKECQRLLKPGGVLIVTAPMQWRHHEVPFDFLRFTRFGIVRLLTMHGFEIKDLSPCGGTYALIGQIFLDHLRERGIQNKLLFRSVNRLALWLDKRIPDPDNTINWNCIAIKCDQKSE